MMVFFILELKTEIHTHCGNISDTRVVGVAYLRVYIDTQIIRDVVVAHMCVHMGIHNLKQVDTRSKDDTEVSVTTVTISQIFEE